MFETHCLIGNIAYSCDDTFSLVSLVLAGLCTCFAPEWTKDLPNRGFELRPVRGVDLKIGLGVAWSKEDPTASRDDIIEYCPVAGSAGQGRGGGCTIATGSIPRSSGASCRG